MTPLTRLFRWKLKPRETRMLIYLLVMLSIAAWRFIPRPWHPVLTVEARHHTIYSSAARQKTEDTAHTMELLYTAYSNRFQNLKEFQGDHPKLKVTLVQQSGGIEEFERIIGPVEQVQTEWHAYIRKLRTVLAGANCEFFKNGKSSWNHQPSMRERQLLLDADET